MVKIWSFDFTETLIDVLMARKTELNRTRKCPYVGVVLMPCSPLRKLILTQEKLYQMIEMI